MVLQKKHKEVIEEKLKTAKRFFRKVPGVLGLSLYEKIISLHEILEGEDGVFC